MLDGPVSPPAQTGWRVPSRGDYHMLSLPRHLTVASLLCFHSLHQCGPSLANCQMAADRCPVSFLQLLPSFTVRVPSLLKLGH